MQKTFGITISEQARIAESHPGMALSSIACEEELDRLIEEANQFLKAAPQEAFLRAQTVLHQASAHPKFYARALRSRAMASGALGNLDQAAHDFQAAHQMARQWGDVQLESQCLHGLASVHQYRGEFALALEQIQHANSLRRQLNDDAGLMMGLNSQGAFLAEMGDLSSAVTCFFDSLQIAERIGSELNELLALSNIGHLKLESGEPERAIVYLERSIAIAERINARAYEAFPLEILASAYQDLKRFDEARQAAERAVAVSREIGNPHHEVNALIVLADIQMECRDLDTAEANLQQALDLARTHQAGRSLAIIYGALGRLYIRLGHFAQAEENLARGMESARERQQQQQVCNLYQSFSDLYNAQGEHKKALDSYREYHSTYKTLQKESLQNRLGAQLAQLAVQRAEQEAELHRLHNRELLRASEENERLLKHIQEQARQLAQLAITDSLTGLYNRRYLREYLCRESASHTMNRLSLALLDLDNFKQINDRFSHSIGDEVLRTTARLLQHNVRETDIVVRYGGEEFVVVLPELSRADAMALCERLRTVIAEFPWPQIHPDLFVTTSIGLADSSEEVFHLLEGEAFSDCLLALADKRLYQAKASGKNRLL